MMKAELFGGLDLSQLDSVTEDEHRDFLAFYQWRFGHPQKGLTYLLDNRPDALKRFRRHVQVGYAPYEPGGRVVALGFMLIFVMMGYEVGVRYEVHTLQVEGMTREQCNDLFAMCFLYCGPRGLETIANAMNGYEWLEPETPMVFPANWQPDPAAFDSGLDYSTLELSADELRSLRDWYLRWAGEVPDYVDFLAAHAPRVLKINRSRFETCLKVLPKQVLPHSLLQFNATRGYGPGIRENLLLSKGFGITKEQALKAVMTGIENGGIETISMVRQAAGDVFDTWDDS